MCRERIWDAVDPNLSPAQADALFATYMSAYHAAWRLFDDVVRCYPRCNHARLGIVTNGRAAEQRKKLSVLGIAPRFVHVAISEEVGVAKPDPAIFLGACSAMRIAPNRWCSLATVMSWTIKLPARWGCRQSGWTAAARLD